MQQKLISHNFVIGKCIILFMVMIYLILTNQGSPMVIGYLFLTCSIYLALLISYEITRTRHLWVLVIAALVLFLMCTSVDYSCFLLSPFLLLDLVNLKHWTPLLYLCSYLCLYHCKAPITFVFCYCTFLLFFYFENVYIIDHLRSTIVDNEQTELLLKDNIDHKENKYRTELSRQHLIFENRYLEDKTHLAQELHDKLGHNINGSTYQLEACKILLESDPQRCREIIQNVIDSLRNGMDGIRMVLRNERPDKKKLAVVQLNVLCQDCIDKYGIDAQLKLDIRNNLIPDALWETILDTTFEAISNSLKYSKCTKITIEINTLHKLVRCCITDNGIGCKNLKDGMGLQGIRKRIRSVNGVLDIDSQDGFKINMLLPLPVSSEDGSITDSERKQFNE